jgi:hypothetical protein
MRRKVFLHRIEMISGSRTTEDRHADPSDGVEWTVSTGLMTELSARYVISEGKLRKLVINRVIWGDLHKHGKNLPKSPRVV